MNMDLYERRNWLSGRNDPTRPKGTVIRRQVSNLEIWSECFGRNPADMKSADSYAIAAIMLQQENWEKSIVRRRVPIYGIQRLYFRRDDLQSDGKKGPFCDNVEKPNPAFLD